MSDTTRSIAVIGAGISGLTAAYQLKKAGLKPVVFEAADYVGGRIKSFKRGDFLFDVGAFIYLGSYSDSIELMREVGLSAQMGRYPAYGAMPRDGKLHFLDFNQPIRSILGTRYLSGAAKLKAVKLFALLFKHWKDLNYDDAQGIAELDTDSVQSYSERELGTELLDYVASVVVRGPWLCDPGNASIGQLLWTMKNFFKPYFYGLDDGMDALPRALAKQLDVRLNHPVSNVRENGEGVVISYREASGIEHSQTFDRCLITTTTDQTLAIYPQLSGVQREFFESNSYISSVNVHIGLKKRPANPATYIMVSAKENPDLCGVIVDHLKARGRAPAHKGLMTVFCSNEWCVKNMQTPDAEVLKQVLRFIEPYYGDLTDDVEDFEIGRWPRVVPVMAEGRFKQVAAYQQSIDARARVQFAGDLVPMGGVNAALVSGKKAAERIRQQYPS